MKKRFPKLNKRVWLAVIAVVIISLAASFIFFRNQQRVAEAGWFNEQWYYRKAITVTNSSGSALTDYQILILSGEDFSSDIAAGKIQSDFGDLRFTDRQGNLLDYYIDNITATTSLSVWVKVTSLPIGQSTIYMYYGNSSAEDSQVTGDQMFDFFDDFNGNDINNTVWSATGSYSVSGGDLTITTGSVYSNNTIFDSPQNRTMEMKAQYTSAASSYSGINIADEQSTSGSNGGSNALAYNMTASGASDALQAWGADGSTSNYNIISGTTVYDISQSTDYIIGFSFRGSTDIKYYVKNLSYTDLGAQTPAGTWNYPFYIWLGYFTGSGAGTANIDDVVIDWVRIRKSASVEPTVGLPSSEEQGPGPVAYWSFDEGYGQTAYDYSPNNNDGTITNAVWKNESECKFGKCLYFDGSGDYVGLAASSNANITGDISVSGWFKIPSSAGADMVLIHKDYQYSIKIKSNGVFNWADSSNWSYAAFGDHNIGVVWDKWHHLAVTKTGGVVKVYLDGIEKLSKSFGGSLTSTANTMFVGCYAGASSCSSLYFNGFIDDVKVYNYARSAAQIKQDYNRGKSSSLSASDQYASLNDGLVGWWQMDESAANSCTGGVNDSCDSSGNGNDGTWEGNATATSSAKYSRAVELDGIDDYIYLPHSGGGEITYSMWLKKDFNDYRRAIKKGGGSGSGDFIIMFTGSEYGVYLGTGQPSPGYHITNGANLEVGKWELITWTYDKKTLKLYVNGKLNKKVAVSRSTDFGAGTIKIGDPYGNNTEDFDGSIDEVRVYNRALSSEEVRHLYEWAPGPVGYWDFEEKGSSGVTTIYDKTGNGHNGTSGSSLNAGQWVSGKYGSAIDFDADDDDISVPYSADLDFTSTSTFTLMAWLYVDELPSDGNVMGIVAKGVKYGIDLYYSSPSSNSYTIRAGTRGGSQLQAISAGHEFGKWYHATLVYKSNYRTELYVNGQLVDTVDNTGQTDFSAESSLYFANNTAVGGNPRDLLGKIDEVKIYNYARTPRQIREDMYAGRKNNPVAYWSFDEGRGTTANDYSGQGNNGTLTNMSTSGTSTAWIKHGKKGGALKFDGVDDYVALSSGVVMNASSSAISLWFRLSDFNGMMVGKNGDSDTYIRALNSTTIRVQTDAVSTYKDYTVPEMSLGTWNHLVVTRDDGTTRVYLNGKESNSGGQTQNPDLTIDQIGRYTNGASGFWYKGMLDEIKIYNYVLTLDEIRQNYNQGKQIILSKSHEDEKTEGLVGWWKMDESSWNGTSGEVIDYSGAGNDGTSYNSINTTSTAKYGRAGYFDGSDDYIQLSNSTPQGSKTISAWIKLVDTVYKKSIFGSYLAQVNSGKLAHYNGTAYLTGSTTLSPGQWYHVAYVFNQEKNTITFYVNGKQDGIGNSPNFSLTTSYIGNYSPTGNFPFYGELDDVKIYNTVRTPEQIMRDYTEGPPPVGYWKFDDMTGTTAVDSSGRGNDGTFGGVPTWQARGKKGSVLEFDGSDDEITIDYSNQNGLDINQGTIMAWAYWDGISGWDNIMTFANSGARNGWKLGINSSNNAINFYCLNSAAGDGYYPIYLTDSNSFPRKEWHHVAVTFEHATGTTARLYVDGVQVKTDVSDASCLAPTANPFQIGDSTGTGLGYGYWQGMIDEVKIYDYVLTPRQIAMEYNGGAPVGYWKFDKGEGETAYDYSGNSNDGTVIIGTGGTQTTTSTAWTNGASGKVNGSLNFDGTDDYIQISDDNSLRMQNVKEFTVSAWIYPQTVSGNHYIINKLSANKGYALRQTNADLNFYLGTGSAYVTPTKVNALSVGNWYYVTGVFNSSTATLYVNGEKAQSSTVTNYQDDSAQLTIGAENQVSNGVWFDGQIDEVKIWNYALTSEEVKKEYNGGFSSFFK